MNDILILLVVSFSVLLILMFILIFTLHARNSKKIQSLLTEHQKLEQQSVLFKQHLMQIEENLNELRAGNRGVSERVNTVAEQVKDIAERQEQIINSEPESRLYSKASKMAAQGASVEELMQDCELPKAEAELLVSLHNPV